MNFKGHEKINNIFLNLTALVLQYNIFKGFKYKVNFIKVFKI